MALNIKFNLKEDTLTSYLDKLDANMKASTEGIAQEGGKSIAKMIHELAPVWENNIYSNHALSLSPLNFSNWHFESSDVHTVLDIVVTGMDNRVSFKEFRSDGRRFKPPEMDYAYYQETGIHSPKIQTPRKRFFVKRATVMEAAHFYESTAKQLETVLHGGTVKRTHL